MHLFPQKYYKPQLFTRLKKKCFLTPNQHIRMISEGSCNTEDCLKFSFAITGINYILKYIKIENSLNCSNIS